MLDVKAVRPSLSAAVVFVIDSCHRDRLMEAHSELAKLLTEKELRDALLLIFANKQVLKQHSCVRQRYRN